MSVAEGIVSKSLAENYPYVVTECELRYVCLTYMEEEQRCFTPMWVFRIEEKPNEGYGLNDDNFKADTFYVDALTGDYYLYKCEQGTIFKNGDEHHILGADREGKVGYDTLS